MFLFSQISNLVIFGIFEHNLFAAKKEINNFRFLTINNKCRNQMPVTQTNQPLKNGSLLGVADRGEVDLNSEVNLLASGNLWQYTNVRSQCE